MRILLYIFAVVLLSSCTGKSFLHQKYTHFRHSPPKTDLPPVAVHETAKEPERFPHIEKSAIPAFHAVEVDTLLRSVHTPIFKKIKPEKNRVTFFPSSKKKISTVSLTKKSFGAKSRDLKNLAKALMGLIILCVLVILLIIGFLFINFWISLIIIGFTLLIILIYALIGAFASDGFIMLKASASEAEEEPQKMSFLTWFFTIILLVPMCLVLGIFFLFQPHWWVGLIILGLGALIFWSWLQSEPELFYKGP